MTLHADRIQAAHTRAPDKARRKYTWLAGHHNELAEPYVGEIGAVEEATHGRLCAYIDLPEFDKQVAGASSLFDIASLRSTQPRVRRAFEFRPQDRLTQDTHSMYGKRVLAASGFVISFTPVQAPASDFITDFDLICAELSNLAAAQGRLLVGDGVFVQGGIDVGWWSEEKDTVMSEGLYDFLSKRGRRANYHASIEPVAYRFRRYEAGSIAFYYLDYMRRSLGELGWWSTDEE